MFGFINIYKPQGKTSHDVVAILRRITKIKQIGHTGTLDPFAEGVLPICIGKATRLIEYLADEKAYIGTVQLGSSTTTYDVEGETVNISDKKINIDDIKKTLIEFQGEILQTPPIYSAIKVKGKKLYEYARKGEEIEIQPRKVNIDKIEIVKFDKQSQRVEIYIECSKGTYIRSIANDLGEKLGCFGHLVKLVRTKAGNFELNNSIPLDKLEDLKDVEKNLIYPTDYLDYPKYELNEVEQEKVSHGIGLKVPQKDGITILTYKTKLSAVAQITDKNARLLKVFV